METQGFSVCSINGNKFKATNVNLKKLQADLKNPKLFAVKLGDGKSIRKDSIAFVAKDDALIAEGKNIELDLSSESIYLQAEDVVKKVDDINSLVNNQIWILIDNTVVFNRGFFQHVEEKKADNQAETE